ncbi:hypothetical protein EMPS_09596 [Entomortierella parvispora]|uniref:Uncharacterized protein n=1 Tax=Entomortierella parvispora TaxID=205924 RepID=A0A9P3HJ48_9FUNG|nr:hypothetical protein EMPS_09596 [Entomortierella parvispora]
MSELQSNPGATSNDRKQMLGILDRFEREAVDQEQLLNMTEDEILQHHILQQQQYQKVGGGGSSSNGTGSESGVQTPGAKSVPRKLTPKERDELIQKAIEQEQLDNKNLSGSITELDKDAAIVEEEIEQALEQEYQDFVNRFAGVDLDQESFDSIWARLNPEEQQEFRERFMISGKPEEDSDVESNVGEKQTSDNNNASDDDEEEQNARLLMKEMEDVMQRGQQGRQGNGSDPSNAILADLDMEDLKALRDAEISELIPIWNPWWEVEAEEAGQLTKVVVSKVTTSDKVGDSDSGNRLAVAAAALGQSSNSSKNIPDKAAHGSSTKNAVQERLVLDEEAMLRPHRTLIQTLDDEHYPGHQLEERTKSLPPMTRPPHQSLIYHICGLLFAFAATSRVLNGDLLEEPEQSLTHVFELCPFFAPPPASSKKATGATVRSPPSVPEVDDFETTLAVLQQSSLNSKLWKGDTLRPEMLSLLLRDLTLLLARPARCLKCIVELEAVFNQGLKDIEADASKGRRLYSRSTLTRLVKKLEFYASYLHSGEWLLKTDRLDQVRTEVVMTGIRVRQEMMGWEQEMEKVSRVSPSQPETPTRAGETGKAKVLIEELE